MEEIFNTVLFVFNQESFTSINVLCIQYERRLVIDINTNNMQTTFLYEILQTALLGTRKNTQSILTRTSVNRACGKVKRCGGGRVHEVGHAVEEFPFSRVRSASSESYTTAAENISAFRCRQVYSDPDLLATRFQNSRLYSFVCFLPS